MFVCTMALYNYMKSLMYRDFHHGIVCHVYIAIDEHHIKLDTKSDDVVGCFSYYCKFEL